MASEIQNIAIPAALAKELEQRALKMGMSVSTYVAFLARVSIHRHDPEFVNAVRFIMTKFPQSMRKLAQ